MANRLLYFDIDGTILLLAEGEPKSALRNGVLENAIRLAGFNQLVCVGNIVNIIYELKRLGKNVDCPRMVFDLCQGVFQDLKWFRTVTSLTTDPEHRVRDIDFSQDWWYLDDLAEHYCKLERADELFKANIGHRIFVPNADDDGQPILNWLRANCR